MIYLRPDQLTGYQLGTLRSPALCDGRGVVRCSGYPRTTRGRRGDPRIIDHSADTLIVEPPRSTVSIIPTP